MVAELFWFAGLHLMEYAFCAMRETKLDTRQVQRGSLVAEKVPLATSRPLPEQPGEQAGSHAVIVFRVTSRVLLHARGNQSGTAGSVSRLWACA